MAKHGDKRPMVRCAALAAICLAAAASTGDTDTALWDQSDVANAAAIDHSDWQALLDAYLVTDDPSGVNRFDYAALQETADHERLAAYLESLQAMDPRDYAKAEQFAYWVNFYNALTVQVVVDAFPVDSILDISERRLSNGPWGDERVAVAGEALTLDDIEHRILRPIWRDPRIHYAVNCASIGCPNLASQAFTGANAEWLLTAAAKGYVNHPRGARFADDGLVVSSIYGWYQEDFGGNEAGVIEHLAQYAEADLATRLRGYQGGLDYDYDWSLNEPR